MSYNSSIMNNLNKPFSPNAKALGGIIIGAAGAQAIIEDENNYTKEDENISKLQEKNEMSLWEFTRFYHIGQIPIIDLIIVYILLYIFNSFCLNYDYKFVLLLTIPTTIILNMFTNKNFKLSSIIIIILIISFYFLFTTKFHQKER